MRPWKKEYVGERFPFKCRFRGECYYTSRCPVETGIERKKSLRMRLIYGKSNDRYM